MSIKKTAPVKDVEEKAPALVNTEVATQTGTLLPSLAGAIPELIERMKEVQDNLESVESFRLPRAKMTASGLELLEGEEPVKEIEGVVIHTKRTNVYYAKPYNPSDVTAPDCFSLDGITPDRSIQSPVNKTCKGCPMAEFGTNSMKSGKACRNLKPVYLVFERDEEVQNRDNNGQFIPGTHMARMFSTMPRQLTVTPASLKSANQYLLDLTERGIAYRKVMTKVTLYKENSKDTYFKLKFSMIKKLDEQQQRCIEFLRNQWLPIMNAQIVDQREMDSNSASQSQATPNGEF